MIKIKNCALFGGTFDPFHNGHLHLIKSILALHRFEKVLVIPAGDPYQKKSKASAEDRFAMTKLALIDEAVEVSDCELRRSGPSYAIDTVNEIKNKYPADQYTWILGSDAFVGVPTWNSFEELARLVDFLVIKRPGTLDSKAIPGINAEFIEVSALDLSATYIRNRIRDGADIEELVPAQVASYVKEKHLYGAA